MDDCALILLSKVVPTNHVTKWKQTFICPNAEFFLLKGNGNCNLTNAQQLSALSNLLSGSFNFFSSLKVCVQCKFTLEEINHRRVSNVKVPQSALSRVKLANKNNKTYLRLVRTGKMKLQFSRLILGANLKQKFPHKSDQAHLLRRESEQKEKKL